MVFGQGIPMSLAPRTWSRSRGGHGLQVGTSLGLLDFSSHVEGRAGDGPEPGPWEHRTRAQAYLPGSKGNTPHHVISKPVPWLLLHFQFLLPQASSAHSSTAPSFSCVRIPSSFFCIFLNLTLKLVLYKKGSILSFLKVYRTWIFMICHIKMFWERSVILVTCVYWKMTFWIHEWHFLSFIGWQIMGLQVSGSNLLILLWFLGKKKKKSNVVKLHRGPKRQANKIILYSKKSLSCKRSEVTYTASRGIDIVPFCDWGYQWSSRRVAMRFAQKSKPELADSRIQILSHYMTLQCEVLKNGFDLSSLWSHITLSL